MGVTDLLNYVVFTNPVSSGAAHIVSGTAKTVGSYLSVSQPQQITMPPVPLWKLAASSGPYIKLAALSGTAAVVLGAYGAHKINATKLPDQARIFETASRYHFFHTLALLSLPLCRKPSMAAIFFTSGIIMFCGTCYYNAFTNDKSLSKVTPLGGLCFIIGWLILLI